MSGNKYTWDEWLKKIADREGKFFALIERVGDEITISGQGFKFIDASSKKEIIQSIKDLTSTRRKKAPVSKEEMSNLEANLDAYEAFKKENSEGIK